VLLEHADFPAQVAQQRRRGQATDAGADDDRIIRTLQPVRTVTPANADGAGFKAALTAGGGCRGIDDGSPLVSLDRNALTREFKYQ
jgi:hypothetical protein